MVLFYSIQIMMKTRSIKIDELLGKLLGPYQGLGASLWSMFFATMINRFGDFVGSFLALYLSRILGFDAARTGLTISLVFTASITDRNCHFGYFSVLRRNSAVTPNYDCFLSPNNCSNQKFSVTLTN